jgi:outer membrane protein assembly factor BamD (BamD/ComL family)
MSSVLYYLKVRAPTAILSTVKYLCEDRYDRFSEVSTVLFWCPQLLFAAGNTREETSNKRLILEPGIERVIAELTVVILFVCNHAIISQFIFTAVIKR